MKKLELLVSSILAGLLIGMSGAIYLGSGKIPFGAVLFSVALFTICTRGMALFTGRVGYLITRNDRMVCVRELLVIWLGNLIGCAVTALAVAYAKPAYREMACELTALKLSESPVQIFLLGVMCGLLMYIAVDHFRTWQGDFGRFVGILLCVPAFIIAGFEHVVADMFYLMLGVQQGMIGKIIVFLLICSLGNACGAWLIPLWDKLRMKQG